MRRADAIAITMFRHRISTVELITTRRTRFCSCFDGNERLLLSSSVFLQLEMLGEIPRRA